MQVHTSVSYTAAMAKKQSDKTIVLLAMRETPDIKKAIIKNFCHNISKTDIINIWKLVTIKAQAFGFQGSVKVGSKLHEYVRDSVWSRAKRSYITKRDNMRKTGAAGGEFTADDDMVRDLIGVDNPQIDGIQEISDTVQQCDSFSGAKNQVPVHEQLVSDDDSGDDAASNIKRPRSHPRSRPIKMVEMKDALRSKRMRLQNEYLAHKIQLCKRKKYHMELDIAIKEQQLNIFPLTARLQPNRDLENENDDSDVC